jgi:transposase InsO family protein
MDHFEFIPTPEAIFRYCLVSRVLAYELGGQVRSAAVEIIANDTHLSADGLLRTVDKRTIYRWLADYQESGLKGLMPKERSTDPFSSVLPTVLLDYFKDQKAKDPDASVPELIKRAQILAIDGSDTANRVTVWRWLNRMGIDTSSRKSIRRRDARRFAYPHRMDMMICDGKHFRAGIERLRRVALFFLDDATRKGLDVVVGTSENSYLFLRGMYRVFLTYGLAGAMYTDRGPGFVAHDVIAVAAKLGIPLIHGEAAYPEGRGKCERFNQTAKAQVLRYFDRNPQIDPACQALELRLRHYLFERYDHNPHESLEGQPPRQRFHNDPKPLTFHKSAKHLRQAFVLHHKRRVSFDNVVSFRSSPYEVPRGHAGTQIVLHHNLLDNSLSIIDHGRLVKLAPVDLSANARSKRAKGSIQKEALSHPLAEGSAQMAFKKDFKPVVDVHGNFPDKEDPS